MYSNNSNAYLIVSSFSSTCLLGLGNDCGVYFVHDDNNQASSRKQVGNHSKFGKPVHIYNATSNGTWWLGRVQRIMRRVGNRWGFSR
jgi:hypothetical protein